MPLDPILLEILRCPETRQTLTEADAAFVDDLNRRIAEGSVVDRAGQVVSEPVDGALLREDGAWLYVIRDQTPDMVIDRALPVARD